MPRFYFHIYNSLGFVPDEEGRKLGGPEQALDEAVKGARSLLSSEVLEGQLDLRGRIEVTDARGGHLCTVQFGDVVYIKTGPVPNQGRAE